ncbi:hypothetical protein PWT90_05544 [Aphanocladium album]|nr:hypothetical protein PWT90_05544 [Aphanocladium album]
MAAAAHHPSRDKVMADFRTEMASAPNLEDTMFFPFMPDPTPQQRSYVPCTKPVDSLKPMLVSQMKPRKHHRGRMALVRVCIDPGRWLAAVAAVVEDEKGTAVPLFAYNMPIPADAHEDTVLPKGGLFLIKEPYLKLKEQRDAYAIRVDHVTDLVRLDEDDARISKVWRSSASSGSSLDLRLQGNTEIKRGNWFAAQRLYTKAIDKAETDLEKRLGHVNRALANLKLERYEAALADATQMADDDDETAPPVMKALFRAASAHYGLQSFARCRATLLRLLVAFPGEPSARALLLRAQARLREQETGRYSFAAMYAQAQQPAGLVDCASFRGPVEVRACSSESESESESESSTGRGRGLFLTEAVAASDLILCEKAAVFYRRKETAEVDESCADTVMYVVGGDHGGDPDTNAAISARLHQKLLSNFDSFRSVLDLQVAADDFDRNATASDSGVVFDSFLVNSIVATNSACCPPILPGRLNQHPGVLEYDPRRHARGDKIPPAYGLWRTSSYMNHACHASTRRVFVGDVAVVRAARALPAGAELTVAYEPPEVSEAYEPSRRRIARWGFACACDMCLARCRVAQQRAAGQRTIVDDIAAALRDASPATAAQTERACRALDERYAREYAGPRNVPCTEMWQVSLVRLSFINVLNMSPMQAIDTIVACLRTVGFVVAYSRDGIEINKWGMLLYPLPKIMGQLYTVYRLLNPEVCPAVKEYTRLAFLLMAGEDESFAKFFPDFD